jgi:predicted nicotinamide N-methyase
MEIIGSSSLGNDEPVVDVLFQRGAFLRKLRELEQQDEAERLVCTSCDEEPFADGANVDKLTLRYDSFLAHQSYYDDYKHVNYRYLDFGNNYSTATNGDRVSNLVIEQDRSLGKGGLVWDAAFILGQHVVNEKCWQEQPSLEPKRIIELGAGTGMTGLMVAKALPQVEMHLTDLPELMPLVGKNIIHNSAENTSGFVLKWGETISSPSTRNSYDVILGADVVASIYSSSALIKTISQLANEGTWVFITVNRRLSSIIDQFEQDMRRAFAHVEIRKPLSDNKNPNVWVLVARRKISFQ